MEKKDKSRYGVYRNFKISPYTTNKEGYTYVFSSRLYKDKFLARYKENRETINHSLSHRFGFNIEVNVLADMALYMKIEKRGFLVVESNGRQYESHEEFVLANAHLCSK